MSTRKRDHLFSLIRALTKSEKRYFKLFAARQSPAQGDKDFVQLFNALDAAANYDEREFRRCHEGQNFVRNFSEAKYYLYKNLLRSLHLYHLDGNSEMRFREMLHQVEILSKKGLYDQSWLLLGKARRLAQRQENLVGLYDVLQAEMRLLPWIVAPAEIASRTADLSEQRAALRHKISNIEAYKEMYFSVYYYLDSIVTIRKAEERAALESLVDSDLFRDEGRALTDSANMYFHHLRLLYHSAIGETERARHHSRQALELLPADLLGRDEIPDTALVSLQWFFLTSIELKKYDEFYERFAWLRQLYARARRKRRENGSVLRLFAFYQYLLICDARRGQFEASVACMDEIEQGLADNRGKLLPGLEQSFCCLLAVLHFSLTRMDDALRWINQALSAELQAESRADVYTFARMLELIIHYELGNHSLLRSLLSSTARDLRKTGTLHKTEKSVLGFLRASLRGKRLQAPASVIQSTLADLARFADDPLEHGGAEIFDYSAWIRSCASAVTYQQALQDRSLTDTSGL